MRKYGFTLVELSIVLVIIGLLIGGILVGQSLIDSVRINSLGSKINQYETAIGLFKNKFKYMPGDYPRNNFAPCYKASSNCYGNGDGSVAKNSSTGYNHDEQILAMAQLVASDMISDNLKKGKFPDTDVNDWIQQGYIPQFKLDGRIASMALSRDPFSFDINKTYLRVATVTPAWPTDIGYDQFRQGFINSQKMMALDAKFDDGVYNTGKVNGVIGFGGSCYNASGYLKSDTDYGCRIYWEVTPK